MGLRVELFGWTVNIFRQATSKPDARWGAIATRRHNGIVWQINAEGPTAEAATDRIGRKLDGYQPWRREH